MKKINNYQERAESLIPGGNSLLSKRRQMFSPSKWPSFFESASGTNVTDIEGKEFIDFSHFSVGTCTLGYANEEVNEEVIKAVLKGNMSTLNAYEEVDMADRLTSMHLWSSMVRFAKTGGEANAIAIRISRASNNKEKIIVHGYHGWHDWYLSANLGDSDALDGHLLPGLTPKGVPRALKNTTIPLDVFNFNLLEETLKKGDVSAVKMEVMRSRRPTDGELVEIRKLCDKYDSLLIFDECTSGFREAFGGMHLNYSVSPDLMVLGKTMSNGYSLTAVLGTKEVMNSSSGSFISSTFWGERTGFVAGIKTLEIMEREKSWLKITKLGEYYKSKLNKTFRSHELEVNWSGMPSLIGYSLNSDKWLYIKTFLTEELLEMGYLHGALFYPSIAHNEEKIDDFDAALNHVLTKVMNLGVEEIVKLIGNKVCHSTFKRLN
jgi:glutamate-1-semialdehyde 2,1-aminomutase